MSFTMGKRPKWVHQQKSKRLLFLLSFLVNLCRMPGKCHKKHLNMIQGCYQEKCEWINFTVKPMHKNKANFIEDLQHYPCFLSGWCRSSEALHLHRKTRRKEISSFVGWKQGVQSQLEFNVIFFAPSDSYNVVNLINFLINIWGN